MIGKGIDKNARIYLMSQRNDIIRILESACVVSDPIDLSSLEMICNQAKETFVLRIQKIGVIAFDHNKQKIVLIPKMRSVR